MVFLLLPSPAKRESIFVDVKAKEALVNWRMKRCYQLREIQDSERFAD